jgi:hypothetical protein
MLGGMGGGGIERNNIIGEIPANIDQVVFSLEIPGAAVMT